MGEKALIAIVSAASALGGATIGAVATYFSTDAVLEGNQKVVKEQLRANQAINQGQIDREDSTQLRDARGVARVYAEQLERAQGALEYAQHRGRWPGRDNLADVALPVLEDRRLILSRLSAHSSSIVVAADGATRTITSIIESNAEQPIKPQARFLIVRLERQLRAGVRALGTVE